MTTVPLTPAELLELDDISGEMTLGIAAADPQAFLERAGKHALLFFTVCRCDYCADRDGWTFLGVKDGEGRGGVSHSLCPGQLAWVTAEMAGRGYRYSEKARS